MERRIDINNNIPEQQDEFVESVLEMFKPNFDKLTDNNGMKVMPVDVLDWQSGEPLMQGFMNKEAFILTVLSAKVTFWSRDRAEIWQKGSTSGNCLILKAMTNDCDQDTFKIYAQPLGPVCHTGAITCYDDSPILYFDPVYQIPKGNRT